MGIIRQHIKADLFRYSGQHSTKAFFKTYWNVPGFRFMVAWRILKYSRKNFPVYIFFRLLFTRMKYKYGLQIPIGTTIGKGFFIGHFGNIIINSGAVIGENCNIAQGVTIGRINKGSKMGCPVIGKRVWMGVNSVIVGNITVGDDALIAPLSFINFDIPANAVVLGNPAKIVGYTGSEGYVNNIVI
jgi:serine O-acetyltransferase